MQRLAAIELQLCFQCLSAFDILRVGTCSRSLHAIASNPLAWQFAAPWYSHYGTNKEETRMISGDAEGDSKQVVDVDAILSQSKKLYLDLRQKNSVFRKSASAAVSTSSSPSSSSSPTTSSSTKPSSYIHRSRLLVPHPTFPTSLMTSSSLLSISEADEYAAHCPLIIELGTSMTYAGFSGDDAPRAAFSTMIGRPNIQPAMMQYQMLMPDGAVGDEAMSRHGIRKFCFPVKKGIIYEFHEAMSIWKHTIYNELRAEAADHPLLLIDSPLNTFANRQRMIETLLTSDSFGDGVPAVAIVTNAECALFATGCTTGLVVHADHDYTCIVPIVRGQVLRSHIRRLRYGGLTVVSYLCQLLHWSYGSEFISSYERTTVQDMIDTLSVVAPSFQADPPDSEKADRPYEHSDGTIFNMTYRLRSNPHEIWFRPTLASSNNIDKRFNDKRLMAKDLGYPNTGVAKENELPDETKIPCDTTLQESIVECIKRCPLEYQIQLWNHIVLNGAPMKIEGMDERVLYELHQISPLIHRDSIRIVGSSTRKQRQYTSWIGASILTSMTAFRSSWLTREEREKYGEEAIRYKCGW